jgi:hypothetical protein
LDQDNSGWEMVQNIKIIVQECVFKILNANEVTMINNQYWISVHVYMMKNWVHIPILLMLELKWVQ